jgi:hypothetical protein
VTLMRRQGSEPRMPQMRNELMQSAEYEALLKQYSKALSTAEK